MKKVLFACYFSFAESYETGFIDFIYMWNLKKENKSTNQTTQKQSHRKMQNKLVVIKGAGRS